ncbi:MAG: class I SAM-dependent methyltransferase [Rhodovarius sp.]|nr:class I SAM-dependent methyltransferase [Rhodovarius sp.]MDW8316049.1 class I SAM-dependent methyltransferase [Rhodovarius sp.]
MSDAAAWDARYRALPGMFGTRPNEYLRSQAWRLAPGARALALGDGEGRNGVWLAEQGLIVTSLDWSRVGLAHARALAEARGVALTFIEADATRWDYPDSAFELVAWIFLHLPPADRRLVAAGACRALAPGGLLVLEGFTPAPPGRRAGGPQDPALLWSRTAVEECFPALEVLELLEGTVLLDEGPKHQGRAEVVRALLRRPA